MVDKSTTSQLDLSSSIQLLFAFLTEHNLLSSLDALSAETGVLYTGNLANKEDFLENVRRGNWHSVLKTVQSTRLEAAALQAVYAQVVRELVLEREWAMA